MAGFDHGPVTPAEPPDARTDARNSRVGLALFAVYLLLYGGFVGVNAFAPGLMARPVVAGVNLAVVWGLGLILAAFLIALIYAWLCRNPAAAAPAFPVAGDQPEARR
jgi:uncharacterized membrane protein (DUF485 family)